MNTFALNCIYIMIQLLHQLQFNQLYSQVHKELAGSINHLLQFLWSFETLASQSLLHSSAAQQIVHFSVSIIPCQPPYKPCCCTLRFPSAVDVSGGPWQSGTEGNWAKAQ